MRGFKDGKSDVVTLLNAISQHRGEVSRLKRGMRDMIEDLQDARASGRVYTYGNIQEKLRKILGEEPE
jgi:hypothetical protein